MGADLDIIAVAVADGGDGLPNRVSPSQVAAFQSCQLRYYFATVLGWREPASRASTAGVLVHDALEQLYRLSSPERTPTVAEALLRERALTHFASPEYSSFREDRELAAGAFRAVANIFTVENPAEVEVEPAGLEAEGRCRS